MRRNLNTDICWYKRIIDNGGLTMVFVSIILDCSICFLDFYSYILKCLEMK